MYLQDATSIQDEQSAEGMMKLTEKNVNTAPKNIRNFLSMSGQRGYMIGYTKAMLTQFFQERAKFAFKLKQ